MRALLKNAIPAFSAMLLAGCVANSTLPSPNIGTILQATPEDKLTASNEDASTSGQQQLANAPNGVPDPRPGTKVLQNSAVTDTAAGTGTALAPASNIVSPAQQAASALGQQPVTAESTLTPAPDQSNPAVAAAPAVANAPTSTDNSQVKPANNLFALFQNNNAADGRARPSQSTREDSGTVVSRSPRVASNRAAASPAPRVIVSRNADRSNRNGGDLPGVDLKKLFGIETEDHDEQDEAVEVASLTNMARRGTHGLLLQRPDVQVGCFPRDLLTILKQVERKFGRTPVVTSGYRSKAYNTMIRGARKSMHVYCKAADIQVQGVSKWALAKYLRSLPARGGVGTYCHTKSVHIDVGGKRDWNRRCRRAPVNKRRKT